MRIGSNEFSLREFAGSLGDLGTLLPLAIGYITVCKMEPAGLLVMMGLANIVTGILYRLPMPIEPMKVLAIVAIAQAWTPEKVCTSALVMGAIWLFMAATGAMVHVARWTPKTVVLGIQLSLGVLLAIEGVKMVSSWWLLGIVAVILAVTLRRSRLAPAAIVLVVLGIVIATLQDDLGHLVRLRFSVPVLTHIDPREIWPVLRDGGLAQIPLTATNAVIATSALITVYWPDRRVTESQLSLNMGVMNIVLPFFGGMPLCHGAGGLAGQYYFGARTGGANIIEGAVEIGLGLLLGGCIAGVFAAFPMAIVGGMMLLVGIELLKSAQELRPNWGVVPVGVTVVGSILFNMATGFVAGMAAHYLWSCIGSRKRSKAGANTAEEHAK